MIYFLFISLISHSNSSFSQTDPLSSLMWHLGYSGYPLNQADYPGHINLSDAHDYYTGAGVVVVVSDDGLQTGHPDLSANIGIGLSRNYNLPSPYTGDPSPTSADQSHGTFVSGFIGASKDNGEGGFGVAPDATLVGFKFIGTDGTLAKKISQATMTTASVFNYSYGAMNCQIDSVDRSYINTLKNNSHRLKQIYVIAGGNEYLTHPRSTCSNIEGDSVAYLANANFDQVYSTPYTIVTAALAHDATKAYYSNPGSNVWISAPGGDLNKLQPVFSTDLSGCEDGYANSEAVDNFLNGAHEANTNCNYSYSQGTSFASPIVAGVVTLIKEANPTLSWRDIKYILAFTADPIDLESINLTHPQELDLAGHTFEPGWSTNGAGYPFHNWYGFGKVNTAQALIKANPKTFNLGNWITTELPDGSSFYKTATLNLNVPDNSATGVSHSISVSKHKVNIEHVRVKLNVTHTYPSDIGIELTSPSGTKSVLKSINDRMVGTNLNATFGSNAFYMERSEGTWRIKIIDGNGLDIGKLVSWQLFIDGNDAGTRPSIAAPKIPVKAVNGTGNKITITAASQTGLLRHEACIYVSGVCNEVDWFPLPSLSFTLSHYSKSGVFTAASTIKKGTYFNVAVRAVNTSEKRTSSKVFKLKKL
jgi:subtilisin-like proprotein convertase family protein